MRAMLTLLIVLTILVCTLAVAIGIVVAAVFLVALRGPREPK